VIHAGPGLREEDVTIQEFNDNNLHFASSIQPNTPAIDAQERGVFISRIISHHYDSSELILNQA
jgi:ABC-type nitrate/sulfonate/bicarbonate transport system substrate-binding protein